MLTVRAGNEPVVVLPKDICSILGWLDKGVVEAEVKNHVLSLYKVNKKLGDQIAAKVATHHDSNVTESLNRIYGTQSSTIDPRLIKIQIASLGGETW